MILLALLLASQVDPPREKFAIFAYHHDEPVMGWEFDPAKPEVGIVQRAELAPTLFSPLLWSKPNPEPTWFAQQIARPAGDGVDTQVLRIDFRDWQIQTVLFEKDKRVDGIGVGDRFIYVRTSHGIRLIDRKTGELSAPDPRFDVHRQFGDVWLVKLVDGRFGLFHPGPGRLDPKRYELPEALSLPVGFLRDVTLSPDRRRVAYLDTLGEPKPRDADKPGPWTCATAVHIWDLHTAKERRLELPMDQIMYSSDGWHPLASHRWSPDGSRVSIDYRDGTQKRVVIDAANVEVIAREELPEPTPYVQPFQAGCSEKLKAQWEILKHFGGDEEQRLGHALLKHAGIAYELPKDWSGTSIGLSSDGKRFLLALNHGGPQDFFLGDLSTLDLCRIPRPARLERASLTIQAVPVH